MKKVALMQPYLFPYLGYFQMIGAVNLFIAYDDVQWIKGGWINRNRILANGEAEYISLPIKKDSYKKHIRERILSGASEVDKQYILTEIREKYTGAPYFESTMKVIERCFSFEDTNVSRFVVHSLQVCSEHLGIKTDIIFSSDITGKKDGLRSQDRVMDIVSSVGAEEYINAIGGQGLYNEEAFLAKKIKLSFIKMGDIKYRQFNDSFTPGLSIIDVMMFNSPLEIKAMLSNYELL